MRFLFTVCELVQLIPAEYAETMLRLSSCLVIELLREVSKTVLAGGDTSRLSKVLDGSTPKCRLLSSLLFASFIKLLGGFSFLSIVAFGLGE